MLAQIPTIPKLVPVFDFSKPYLYRGAYGGRGSGKTRGFALAAALRAWQLSESGVSGVVLCGREFMNSLEDSSMAEVKAAIKSIDWLNDQFDIGEKYIRTKNRRIEFVFAGLRHNLESLKSKSRILIAWIDEAEAVSEEAWRKLLPTVREEGAEVWITWNPEKDGSPTDIRFRKKRLESANIVELNYHDNPFFPATLQQRRKEDQELLDDGTYAWIWEGAYREESEAQIFAKCFEIAEFEPGEDWTMAQGIDWGFANDPTAATRSWVWDNKLFIEHEAVKVGLELDDTPSFIKNRIPDFEKWEARADNSRPESIRYVQRHGLPRVVACEKGKGSVEDGIAHIKSYQRVIIHPRCAETIREFRTYSYKVDRLSGAIKPEPMDANNHCIAKGQTVWTAKGEVPIEDVKAGDRVMTRSGYKEVKKAWLSKKNADVYEVDCGATKLIATGNHKVFTVNRGFVRVDALRYTDDVLIGGTSCQKWKQLRSAESHGEGIRTRRTSQIEATSKRRFGTERLLACIGGYGSNITGRSPKAVISTIRTGTPGIMTSATLSVCIPRIICRGTLPEGIGEARNIWRILKEFAPSQKRGTLHRKAEKFTGRLAAWHTRISHLMTNLASIAVKCSRRENLAVRTYSVAISANRHGVARRALMTKNVFANGAEQSSRQIKTQKSDFVTARVRCIRAMPERVDCYDLEVADQHEFFASGILVHNCIDGIRYALEPLMKLRNGIQVDDSAWELLNNL